MLHFREQNKAQSYFNLFLGKLHSFKFFVFNLTPWNLWKKFLFSYFFLIVRFIIWI